MCIAISKPPGLILEKSTYEMCFEGNPDGAGFAVLQDGVITVLKGFFTFEEFYAAFQPLESMCPLVHFRIATHGTINEANCHPWYIPEFQWNDKTYSFAIIHNGILDYESSAERSDTGHFVHDLLEPHLKRDPHFPFTAQGQFFLDRAIGTGNKMVILRNDGMSSIIRAKAGEEDLGAWFSNTSYKFKKFKHTAGYASMWDKWQKQQMVGVKTLGDGTIPAGGNSVTEHQFSQRSLISARPTAAVGDELADLRHLPRRDRKKLRRLARDVAAYWGKRTDAPDKDMVQFLREEFMDTVAGTELLTVFELDREILKSGFKVDAAEGYSDHDTTYVSADRPGGEVEEPDDQDLAEQAEAEDLRREVQAELAGVRRHVPTDGTHLDLGRIDPYDVQSSPVAQINHLNSTTL